MEEKQHSSPQHLQKPLGRGVQLKNHSSHTVQNGALEHACSFQRGRP